MSAVRNSDGSVTVDGVTLTATQVSAISQAQALVAAVAPVVRPLMILTGSGRRYGQSGTPRFGIWFDGRNWWYLDANKNHIPATSWKPKNLNRAKFTFAS